MSTIEAFRDLTGMLRKGKSPYIFAGLNDLLTKASGEQLALLPRPAIEDPYIANYVAAMVETAAHRQNVIPPQWTGLIAPLAEPAFAVPWMSVRAHLLLESPVPFRRRNIFVNATIGDRL